VDTRRRILKYMRAQLLAGQSPTLREVQAEVGLKAVESVRQHLATLVNEGSLLKASGRSRGYSLPGGPLRRGRPVPVLGAVQAGALTFAEQEILGFITVEGRADSEELFALTVRGESMVGAGILPGDTVLVRRQPQADHGQLVVALIGDEATVKRLVRQPGRIALEPANPIFSTIEIEAPEQLTLLGRVVEVRRRLDCNG
jgi:repressor LexA